MLRWACCNLLSPCSTVLPCRSGRSRALSLQGLQHGAFSGQVGPSTPSHQLGVARTVHRRAPASLQVRNSASGQLESFGTEGAAGIRRAFADFKVYKGKAAVTVLPIRPTWKRLPDGGASIDRQGTLLLEIAPAGTVERTYEWSKKLTFAMNATEIGTIIAAPDVKNEFFHDPNMGRGMEGTVRKVLRVEPTPDKSGYFFSVSVNDKSNPGASGSLTVPLSIGEFCVFRTLCQYALPHLLGFDEVFNMSPQLQSEQWGHDTVGTQPTAAFPQTTLGAFDEPHSQDQPAVPATHDMDEPTGEVWGKYASDYVGSTGGALEAEQNEYYQPSPDSADFHPPTSDDLGPPSSQYLSPKDNNKRPTAFGEVPPF